MSLYRTWMVSAFVLTWCSLCFADEPQSAKEALQGAPWPHEPFAATAQELLAAGVGLPPRADGIVDVLAEHTVDEVLSDGRLRRTSYLVYRILDRNGVDGWSQTQATWSPWFQKRPEVRARVIDASGREFTLDPKTVVEEPVQAEGQQMFTDRRKLRAALPGVGPRAIVEEMVTYEDHTPRFASGRSRFMGLGSDPRFRSRHRRYIIRAPADLSLHVVPYAGIGKPKLSRLEGPNGTLAERTWDLLPGIAWESREPNTDPREAPGQVVGFSTVPSWEVAARDYHQMTQPRLAAEGATTITPLIEGLTKPADRKALVETVRTIAERIWKRTRYTGMELGAASVIPATPDTVLKRGYGDCKDLAVLLVACLARLEVTAHPVLVMNEGFLPDPRLPGLDSFNHVIATVEADPPIWVDMTVPEVPVDSVPSWLQGRQVLAARTEKGALEALPSTPYTANHYRVERTYAPVKGTWGVTERTTAKGAYATYILGIVHRNGLEAYRKDYVSEAFDAPDWSEKASTAVPGHVVLDLTASPVKRVGSERHETHIYYDDSVVFGLPDAAWPSAENAEPRQTPLYLPVPNRRELVIRIPLAGGWRVDNPPKSEKVSLGGGTLERSFVQNATEAVLTIVQDTGPGPWTAEQVKQARAFLKPYADRKLLPALKLVDTASELITKGKIKEGLALYRAQIDAGDPSAARRLASSLMSTYFGAASRISAQWAVQNEPKSADAHWIRGLTLTTDDFGLNEIFAADAPAATAAFEKVLGIEPENSENVHWYLAKLLMNQPSDPKRLESIIQHLEQVDDGNEDAKKLLGTAYLEAGKSEPLMALAKQFPKQADINAAASVHLLRTQGLDALSRSSLEFNPDRVLAVLTIFGEYEHARTWLRTVRDRITNNAGVRLIETLIAAPKGDPPDTPRGAAERFIHARITPPGDARTALLKRACSPELARILADTPDDFLGNEDYSSSMRTWSPIAHHLRRFGVDIVVAVGPKKVSRFGERFTLVQYAEGWPSPERPLLVRQTEDGHRVVGIGLDAPAIGDAVIELLDAKNTTDAAALLGVAYGLPPTYGSLINHLEMLLGTDFQGWNEPALRQLAAAFYRKTDPKRAKTLSGGFSALAEPGGKPRKPGAAPPAPFLVALHAAHFGDEAALTRAVEAISKLELHHFHGVLFQVLEAAGHYRLAARLAQAARADTTANEVEQRAWLAREAYVTAYFDWPATEAIYQSDFGRTMPAVNQAVWAQVLFGTVDRSQLQRLATLARLSKRSWEQHTAACALAELGEIDEMNKFVVAAGEAGVLDATWHWPIARSFEHVGLPELARAHYLAMNCTTAENQKLGSTCWLGQKRLKAMAAR